MRAKWQATLCLQHPSATMQPTNTTHPLVREDLTTASNKPGGLCHVFTGAWCHPETRQCCFCLLCQKATFNFLFDDIISCSLSVFFTSPSSPEPSMTCHIRRTGSMMSSSAYLSADLSLFHYPSPKISPTGMFISKHSVAFPARHGLKEMFFHASSNFKHFNAAFTFSKKLSGV